MMPPPTNREVRWRKRLHEMCGGIGTPIAILKVHTRRMVALWPNSRMFKKDS